MRTQYVSTPVANDVGRLSLIALVSVAVALVLGQCVPPAFAQGTKYATADEAYFAGALFLNRNEDALSQKPLEEALKMAPDDKYKIKVYRALTRPYSLLQDPEKMFVAVEFILEKSDSPAERSLARSALISYLQPRGKTDAAIKRYEDQLAKQADSKTALFLLSEVYDKLRPNPKRAAELGEKLGQVLKTEGGELDVNQAGQLAAQYVKSGKFKEGAELYEQIAVRDSKLRAWSWKEAAAAWLKAKDQERALAAAKASDAGPPESRSEQLAHFWHRNLGDIFLQVGEPALAVPHYEQAIAKTNIEGYIKDTKASLLDAQAKAAATPGKGTAGTATAGSAVDLNTASLRELTAVDGMTEALATQIIDRRKKAPFKSVSELIELDGVDKTVLARLRGSFTIGGQK